MKLQMEVNRPVHNTTLVKNHDKNKTYILVKLSESLSNAIQEYSAAQSSPVSSTPSSKHHKHDNSNRHNNNHHPKLAAPTIKFHGTRGAIKFANGKTYDFSLDLQNNSIECIKQTKNKWESVNKLAYCLQVKGKDDVYQRTKTKLEAAEKEKRKFCTKLLGSPEHNSSKSSTTTSRPKLTTSLSSLSQSSSSKAPIPATVGSSGHRGDTSTGSNELKRYKADFNQDFQEYQNLLNYLREIEARFRKLREKLKRSVVGSEAWEAAKEQIFTEYETVKSDNNFHRARNRYKQLHEKLTHLKKKILQIKRQKLSDSNMK